MSQRDVQWFMTALAKAWSSLSPAAVASFHDAPCLLSSVSGNRVLEDEAALLSYFTRMIGFYRKQRVSQVELVKTEITVPRVLAVPLFANTQSEWRLWGADRMPIVGFHTTQLLRRTPDGWRVSTTASHDEQQRFKARRGK